MISLENRNDQVSMVSSDGEPHEILTLAAVSSGIVGAIILLVIVGILIKYNRKQSSNYKLNTKRLKLFPCRQNYSIPTHTQQMSISTITGVIRLQSELSSTSQATTNSPIATCRDFIIPINLHEKDQSMQNVSGVVSVAC